jgi:hypothetical protein
VKRRHAHRYLAQERHLRRRADHCAQRDGNRTSGLKLSVHTIVAGRYYKAGEEVPDNQVSPTIAKYAVPDDAGAQSPKPSPLCDAKTVLQMKEFKSYG